MAVARREARLMGRVARQNIRDNTEVCEMIYK